MNTLTEPIIYFMIVVTVILLMYVRMLFIEAHAVNWNYNVHRFEHHCLLYQIYDIKADDNRVNTLQAWLLLFMIWKVRPRYFFSFTPNFKEIDQFIDEHIKSF